MSEIALSAPVAPSPTELEGGAPPDLSTDRFTRLASPAQLERTVRNLEANGIHAIVVRSKEEARKVVEELLPASAEVFDSTSETLLATGLDQLIQTSGKYQAIRPRILQLREAGQDRERRRLGSSPEYIVGSVHAITENGEVVIASGSGSQLGPYAWGAGKVIWVAGTHKIVPSLDEAFQRVYEHSLPLESIRARKAYGVPGSVVAKLLVVNRETQPGRITAVLVTEPLGF